MEASSITVRLIGCFSPFQLMGEREEDEKGAFDIPIFTEEFLDHNKGQH